MAVWQGELHSTAGRRAEALCEAEGLGSGPPFRAGDKAGRLLGLCPAGHLGIQFRLGEGGSHGWGDSTSPGARLSSTPFPLDVVTWSRLGSGKCRRDQGTLCKAFFRLR